MALPDSFNCEVDCPQHGRNDQRIATLEQVASECKKDGRDLAKTLSEDKKEIWKEIDDMKADAVKQHQDLNRRIGEKVPTKTGMTLLVLVVGIFTTIITVNISSNNKVNDKLDSLSSEVLVLKALALEKSKQDTFYRELLREVRQFRTDYDLRERQRLQLKEGGGN